QVHPGLRGVREFLADPRAAGLGAHRPRADRQGLRGADVRPVPGDHRRDHPRGWRVPRDRRMTGSGYDALLLVSFGGPEGPDDVLPFLENVTRGRGVPRERLAEVGEHYLLFGGVSPINAQNEALLAALRAQLADQGLDLPVYWGNRNWRPYLADAVRQMRDDGVRRALAFVTAAYSSYSGCRQYRENLADAIAAADGAPEVDKLRLYFDHPGF